jgi:hypothetical protein
MTLASHLTNLPAPIALAVEQEFRHLLDHFLKEEWDDAQVDAGKFSEAVLRALEWHITGTYTPIDGKSRPERKQVNASAARATALPPSLRLQIPACVELISDFRNGRNAAHLGGIEANRIDATCVVGLVTWVMAELVRLETKRSPEEVQVLIEQLSERQVPLVQHIGDRPIVLDPSMTATSKALILLYQKGRPVPSPELREWAEYHNTTRWRIEVMREMARKKYVYVDTDEVVHLLRPGVKEAQRILVEAGLSVA